ncbi:quinol:cytochrome C oxidoreductase [Bacteroidia bacterium]|nr:quinol:cytochrome C oxidoreductase [Bacteroidia bacterium]MDB4107744.1 quinol:cytochrome C oxidoreductase [Bacteroidia bacterium]MDB9881663.1 quinol:cytochrome C oxidoreductase [Bacteroidia bacterium]
MGHHIINEVKQEKFEFSGRAKMIAIGLFLVGAILAGIGSMQVKNNWDHVDAPVTEHVEDAADHIDEAHGEHHQTLSTHGEEAHAEGHHGPSWKTRVWANMLLNSYYFWLFAVGAIFFIAVNYVANAGWAVMLKRIMEAQSAYLGIGSILLLAVIWLGKGELYHWVQYFDSGATPIDAILDSKHWLLNNSSIFFFIPFVLIVWYLIRTKLRRNSVAEDNTAGLSMFKNSTRWSAGFIFFFAFSFSALSWLIIMSIDAHWYSTMFSVYNFAISFVTSLSVMMLILQYLKSKGYMEMVSDEVVHDLGKFMFAFCIFWTYIFLSQWLLIWYTNLPEETVYFDARLTAHFKPIFFVNLFMSFLAPFFVLMMRNAKRSPIVLLTAALVIVVGHWVDMYLLIMPGTVGEKAGIGMLEIGTTMAFAGIFIYTVLHSLSKANLYPVNHPYILESANHDVGP